MRRTVSRSQFYSAFIALLFVLSLGGILKAAPQQTVPGSALSQSGAPLPTLKLDTGEEIFQAACIGCHGPDAKGQPLAVLGFEPPATFPDFTDCNGSTRERRFDWRAVIHEGGQVARGFSEIMPSFGEALTLEQIDKVTEYLRTRCPEPEWPLGEMNFPRALFTEKAFPEDEWVFTSAVNASGTKAMGNEIIYEKRFGVRNQFEIGVPFSFVRTPTDWAGGAGDLVGGYKRVLMSRPETGSILSFQGEVAIPTGNAPRDLGAGTAVFEAFGTFGRILPNLSFIQAQVGTELPTDTGKAPRAFFARTAIGRSVAQGAGFGRLWTPMIEVLADREFETGARTNWDIVPEFQVSLSRRQHVRVNVGIRQPINNRDGRSTQIAFYALWDWFDGGLREGW